MNIYGMNSCCRSREFGGFGNGHFSERGQDTLFSTEQIKEWFTSRLSALQRESVQVVYATPTSHQPSAIKALKELGFVSLTKKRLDEVAVEYNHGDGWVKHQMVPMVFLVPPDERTFGPSARRLKP